MSSYDPEPVNLTYRIAPDCPAAHLFSVEVRIERPVPGKLVLAMPAWCPGSYMIRDFARNLLRIDARGAAGHCLDLIKRDKQTWELTLSDGWLGPLSVRYQVYAWDNSVRAAHLDRTHGYFNGPSLLLQVRGYEAQPCRIELLPPVDERDGDWRVATSLQPAGAPAWGFGAYQAQGYADLIDHPVELGRFDLLAFAVRGVPHTMAISGRQRMRPYALAAGLDAGLRPACSPLR